MSLDPGSPREPGLYCGLIPWRGPCRAYLPMWYYNVTAGTCSQFVSTPISNTYPNMLMAKDIYARIRTRQVQSSGYKSTFLFFLWLHMPGVNLIFGITLRSDSAWLVNDKIAVFDLLNMGFSCHWESHLAHGPKRSLMGRIWQCPDNAEFYACANWMVWRTRLYWKSSHASSSFKSRTAKTVWQTIH